jgi:uncharacterized membrane protein
MSLLLAGLVVFLGVHLLPTLPRWRGALVARWGAAGYKTVFSLVSALGLVLIVIGYARSGTRVPWFEPWPAARDVAPYAMTLSFILLAAANMRTHLRRALGHPMLLGVLIWASVHLFANGDRAGSMLFGAFLGYALIDLASAVKRRAVKVFVPAFTHDLIAIIAGVVVALAVMVFHRPLFGVAAVAFGI